MTPDVAARAPRARVFARWIVAGPLTLACSVLVMAGMSVWFPAGAAGINHIAFPLILFPAIWAALFFYAVLAQKPWRAGAVLLLLAVVNAVPVLAALRATLPE